MRPRRGGRCIRIEVLPSNGSTVGRRDARQVRVEGRRHATHQKSCVYTYLQKVVLKGDHAVIQQSSKPVMVDHGSFRLSAMAVRYPTEIDGEVAHLSAR